MWMGGGLNYESFMSTEKMGGVWIISKLLDYGSAATASAEQLDFFYPSKLQSLISGPEALQFFFILGFWAQLHFIHILTEWQHP